jgi:hypothetical protein
MAISPLSAAGPASIAGAGSAQKVNEFSKLLKGQGQAGRLETQPTPAQTEAKATQHASAGRTTVESSQRVDATSKTRDANPTKMIDEVSHAQSRMDQILKLAESGKSFSPAELLSLQAQTYRASQELDLAGKVVEKATGGVKQVLQTQV